MPSNYFYELEYETLAEKGLWKTADGSVILIEEMSLDHLDNTIAKWHRDELAYFVEPCISAMEVEREVRRDIIRGVLKQYV